MEETYTFSRALHLMRYGGKKMRSVSSNKIYKIIDEYIMVKNNIGLFRSVYSIDSHKIMGSWVEVKE